MFETSFLRKEEVGKKTQDRADTFKMITLDNNEQYKYQFSAIHASDTLERQLPIPFFLAQL